MEIRKSTGKNVDMALISTLWSLKFIKSKLKFIEPKASRPRKRFSNEVNRKEEDSATVFVYREMKGIRTTNDTIDGMMMMMMSDTIYLQRISIYA